MKKEETTKPCVGCCSSGTAVEDPVKKHYSAVAREESDEETARKIALKSGYTEADLALIPREASMGLGCGNSVAAAELKQGEMVLDLGCGAGMDLFLSGAKIAPSGKAVGVDFSEDMVKRGREVAAKYKRDNVEFYQSEIAEMPFLENTFDVAISNCVLNLVPDKQKAFAEICRVLKRDGRFVVSDIVIKKPLPEELRKDVAAVVGCIGRAVEEKKYRENLEKAGFKDVSIEDRKRDLMNLYYKPGFVKKAKAAPSAGDKGSEVSTATLDKYDLNEYAMSCIIKAYKK